MDLLNIVATNYFEMAWCFEILIFSWMWALCLLQLVLLVLYVVITIFYEPGNDWEELLNYFEIVLPYTTLEKWSFLSVIIFVMVWRIDVQIKTCFLPWRVFKHEYMMCPQFEGDGCFQLRWQLFFCMRTWQIIQFGGGATVLAHFLFTFIFLRHTKMKNLIWGYLTNHELDPHEICTGNA